MYELTKIKDNTYLIPSPTNIGLYLDGNDVYLIDSGNDDDAAKKVLKIIEANHWHLKMIINTHYHADHTGGNNYLIKHTDCQVYIHPNEIAYLINPALEVTTMWGGVPIPEYVDKSVQAKPTPLPRITTELPDLFTLINLPGHSPNMIGLKTPDDVLFIGDALLDPRIINKYNVCYIYDVLEYLASLKELSQISASYYIPSHGTVLTDLTEYLQVNMGKTFEICSLVTASIKTPLTIEDLVAIITKKYHIPLSNKQYVLITTTIKGYIKYLLAKNLLKIVYINNKQYIIETEENTADNC